MLPLSPSLHWHECTFERPLLSRKASSKHAQVVTCASAGMLLSEFACKQLVDERRLAHLQTCKTTLVINTLHALSMLLKSAGWSASCQLTNDVADQCQAGQCSGSAKHDVTMHTNTSRNP